MTDTGVRLGPLLVVLLLVLALAAAALTYLARIGSPKDTLVAAVRAVVQLAVVSLIIGAVLRSAGWTLAFVALMLLVAAMTAGKRITGRLHATAGWALVPVAGSVLPTLALILASTAVPWHPASILPVAGILIGGSMVASSLAGRRCLEELRDRQGEYEAALSIGLSRREAVYLVGRPAAALALQPGLDQTRTVGLVTLPGAFVGVLLGGASPLQAGAAQVLVLIALMLVQAAATVLTVELVASGRLHRERPLTA